MSGLIGKAMRFARSPQGRKALNRAQRYVSSPEGKEKIASLRGRMSGGPKAQPAPGPERADTKPKPDPKAPSA